MCLWLRDLPVSVINHINLLYACCPLSQCSQHQHLMSSFTIIGFFGLASGHHLQTVKPGTAIRTWHAHYTTAIQCINPPHLPAGIHIYSPINDILHPDNTIMFIVAWVHVPHTGNVLLDALRIVPCPRDPSQDSYNATGIFLYFTQAQSHPITHRVWYQLIW